MENTQGKTIEEWIESFKKEFAEASLRVDSSTILGLALECYFGKERELGIQINEYNEWFGWS